MAQDTVNALSGSNANRVAALKGSAVTLAILVSLGLSFFKGVEQGSQIKDDSLASAVKVVKALDSKDGKAKKAQAPNEAVKQNP